MKKKSPNNDDLIDITVDRNGTGKSYDLSVERSFFELSPEEQEHYINIAINDYDNSNKNENDYSYWKGLGAKALEGASLGGSNYIESLKETSDKFEKEHPTASTVAQVAGAVAPFVVPGAGVGTALARFGGRLVPNFLKNILTRTGTAIGEVPLVQGVGNTLSAAGKVAPTRVVDTVAQNVVKKLPFISDSRLASSIAQGGLSGGAAAGIDMFNRNMTSDGEDETSASDAATTGAILGSLLGGAIPLAGKGASKILDSLSPVSEENVLASFIKNQKIDANNILSKLEGAPVNLNISDVVGEITNVRPLGKIIGLDRKIDSDILENLSRTNPLTAEATDSYLDKILGRFEGGRRQALSQADKELREKGKDIYRDIVSGDLDYTKSPELFNFLTSSDGIKSLKLLADDTKDLGRRSSILRLTEELSGLSRNAGAASPVADFEDNVTNIINNYVDSTPDATDVSRVIPKDILQDLKRLLRNPVFDENKYNKRLYRGKMQIEPAIKLNKAWEAADPAYKQAQKSYLSEAGNRNLINDIDLITDNKINSNRLLDYLKYTQPSQDVKEMAVREALIPQEVLSDNSLEYVQNINKNLNNKIIYDKIQSLIDPIETNNIRTNISTIANAMKNRGEDLQKVREKISGNNYKTPLGRLIPRLFAVISGLPQKLRYSANALGENLSVRESKALTDILLSDKERGGNLLTNYLNRLEADELMRRGTIGYDVNPFNPALRALLQSVLR